RLGPPPARLGLVASLVVQERGQDDERVDLKELRLPVLEGPLPEVHDVAVPTPEGRHSAVGLLVGDVLPPAEDRLQRKADEEENADDDAEAVVPPQVA